MSATDCPETHLANRREAGLVVVVVLLQLAALRVKDVDEHLADGRTVRRGRLSAVYACGKEAAETERTATLRKMVCFCETK